MSAFRIAATNQARQITRLGARYQSQLARTEFEVEREAVKHHAAEAAETWKKIALFVCVPALLASGVNAYSLFSKHSHHMKEHPREWVKYPYMNYRARDFFWGKESLFFNPKTNLSVQED